MFERAPRCFCQPWAFLHRECLQAGALSSLNDLNTSCICNQFFVLVFCFVLFLMTLVFLWREACLEQPCPWKPGVSKGPPEGWRLCVLPLLPAPHSHPTCPEGGRELRPLGLLTSLFGCGVSCVDSDCFQANSKVSDSAKFQVLGTVSPGRLVPRSIQMADPWRIFTQPEAEMEVYQ